MLILYKDVKLPAFVSPISTSLSSVEYTTEVTSAYIFRANVSVYFYLYTLLPAWLYAVQLPQDTFIFLRSGLCLLSVAKRHQQSASKLVHAFIFIKINNKIQKGPLTECKQTFYPAGDFMY